MDWKDPFARNGSVRRLDRNDVKKSESSIKLELVMPSTEEPIDDLRDPFSPVSAPDMADPFEDYNRFMFDFNEGFYDSLMEPVVRGYRDVVNEGVRMAISNIFDNAMAPLKLVSSILQGDLDKSGRVIGRTIINTTLGVGGMFDVADKAFQIKDVNEDLDQVLGAYGVPTGPYIVIPIFGPSYVRNIFGKAGGTFLSPIAQFSPGLEVGVGLTASDKINDTSFIVDDIDQLEESSIDKYESVRDFYNQYRFRLQNE
jgi:phospholipid-binding lipoprotein MlaA